MTDPKSSDIPTPPALSRLEVLELRRFYQSYVAEKGQPETWGLRSEVFEALLAAALLPPDPAP